MCVVLPVTSTGQYPRALPGNRSRLTARTKGLWPRFVPSRVASPRKVWWTFEAVVRHPPLHPPLRSVVPFASRCAPCPVHTGQAPEPRVVVHVERQSLAAQVGVRVDAPVDTPGRRRLDRKKRSGRSQSRGDAVGSGMVVWSAEPHVESCGRDRSRSCDRAAEKRHGSSTSAARMKPRRAAGGASSRPRAACTRGGWPPGRCGSKARRTGRGLPTGGGGNDDAGDSSGGAWKRRRRSSRRRGPRARSGFTQPSRKRVDDCQVTDVCPTPESCSVRKDLRRRRARGARAAAVCRAR